MAKDNLFLGQARGKIGDIVFYRMNGVQMSRTRNRHPRNPDTNPQKVQRAISATVSQLYRAGREIFDHSFQGKSVGSKNQHYFLSENMRILRGIVSEEINIVPDGVTAQLVDVKGRVVMPSATTPVGFDGAIMSQGDYQQLFFGVSEAYTPSPYEDGTPLTFTIPAAADAAETCADYASRLGLIAGDIYTICGVQQSNQATIAYDDGFGSQGWFFKGSFFAVRLRVLPSFITSTDPVTGKTLADMMMIDRTFGDHLDTTNLMAKTVGSTFTLMDVGDKTNLVYFQENGTWGNIIRSRLDRDLRSTTYMRRHQVYMNHGIIPGYLINAWSRDVNTLGNSELFLEGGQGVPVPQQSNLTFLGTFTIENQSSENYGKKVVVGTNSGRKIVIAVCRNSNDGGGRSVSACKALIINNDNTLGLISLGDAFAPAAYTTDWAPIAVAEVTSDALPSAANYPYGAIVAVENKVSGANVWPTAAELYEAAFGVPFSI